ncbi:MAG: CoA transferase, partial [Solirubrobacterales bacterium]|nr:CoA transferase [Solirubrobacterales bacterium]
RDELTRALARVSATEAEEAIRAEGGVAAALRSRAQWLASPMGQAEAAEPWIRFSPGELDQRVLRLEDLRVLDFTRVIAGPVATKFLAALGADVLRVDPPQNPELLEQHLDVNAGKRVARADLTDSETLAQIHALAADADIVVLGYRPGALARFGLDPETLHARHPHLAIVHLDAWGDTGPWAQQRGFDSIVQSACGIGLSYSKPDGSPGALPVQALDYATGFGAAAAALALLRRGGVAHLSLARTATELYALDKPTGEPVDLPVPMHVIATPHSTITAVNPITGPPRAPGRYGAASLEWR